MWTTDTYDLEALRTFLEGNDYLELPQIMECLGYCYNRSFLRSLRIEKSTHSDPASELSPLFWTLESQTRFHNKYKEEYQIAIRYTFCLENSEDSRISYIIYKIPANPSFIHYATRIDNIPMPEELYNEIELWATTEQDLAKRNGKSSIFSWAIDNKGKPYRLRG